MNVRDYRQDQGFAHLGLIVGVVVFVGAIGLIAWRVWDAQQNNSTGNNAIQQAIANAKCDSEDKDICKFYASWKASTSYKVVSTDTREGQTTTSTFESADSGKRYRMATTVDGKPYETISIDTTVYVKDAAGTWWKQTAQPDQPVERSDNYTYDFTDPNQTAEQKTTYKLLGKEPCGNLTCFKYQIVDSTANDLAQYMWFDTKDYQLRRMRTETAGSTSDQTFSYANITINAPSPVKDLSPNQFLNPQTGEVTTMPSEADIQKQIDEALNAAQ